MDSEKKVNQQLSEYTAVLAEAGNRVEEMLAAFNASKFAAGHNRANEIGELYAALDDANPGERIANLVKMVASAMYFGGIEHQLSEQAKAREKKFSPPF